MAGVAQRDFVRRFPIIESSDYCAVRSSENPALIRGH